MTVRKHAVAAASAIALSSLSNVALSQMAEVMKYCKRGR